MLLALAIATLLQPSAGVTRTVLTTTSTLEAARVEYQPGAADAEENHGYDVVLVPLDAGITAEVDGVPTQWTPGIPILVSRGAPHHFDNRSMHVVRFIEVRTVGDEAAGTNAIASGRTATIVRSTFDTYVRATVWRIGPHGYVQWPADADAVIVDAAAGTVAANPPESNATDAIEVVRVSRAAAR